jgi:hypothetical protein
MRTLRQFPLRAPGWPPSEITHGPQPYPYIPPPPQNLVVNSSFTGSLGGWTVFGGGVTWDGNVGRTGVGSCKMVGDGVYNRDIVSTPIPVIPGDVLTCSAWLGWDDFDSHGAEPVHLAGVLALAGVVTAYPVLLAVSPAGDSGVPYQLANSGTIPDGVDSFALRLSLRDVGTGTIWWDDAEVYKNL